MRSSSAVGLTAILGLTVGVAANAQLTATSDRPVIYGHHHINVSNLDEHRKFWVDTLGGTSIPFGNLEVVKFTNVLVIIREQEPSGGTRGTTVNHIGFEIDGLAAFCADLERRGVTFDMPYTEVESLGIAIAFFTDPFGTYIELTEGLDNF